MSATIEPRVSVFGPEIDMMFERLMQIEGKAEIVDGRIIVMSPAGTWPSLVALQIPMSLTAHARKTRTGRAVGDNAIFRVRLPHRDSFSPDAAYYIGPSARMKPFEGAPVFAAEVRSIGDYGPRGDQLAAEKRADYFAAGTLVVWDVDLLSNDVVKVYRAGSPDTPTIYRPGDTAEAEPAVPNWTVAVSELLPDDWEPTRPTTPN
jgi:Uma2 family endonuclease